VIRGSATFEAAIQESHVLAVRCEAWMAGRRVASDLPLLEDASISVDSSRFVRRTAHLSFADPSAALRRLLNMPGCEIRVWRGVSLKFGAVEDLPIHWGLVDKPSQAWPGKVITVDSPDRAQRVAYDRFPHIRQSTPGMTVSQQIQQLVGESIPRLRFVDTTGDTTLVAKVAWERNRNDAVASLAASIGAETFACPDGRWILRPIQTLLGIPLLRIREAETLISAVSDTDWSEVNNDIIVTSERADGVTFSGRATDNDPASETWVGGPLGRRTGFFASSLPTSTAQCNVLAAGLLARQKGARRSVTYTALAHPGVEAGERHDVTKEGSTSRLVVDSFEFPVFGAAMTYQGRLQVVPEGVE